MEFITCHNRIAADLWANSRLRTMLRLVNPRDSKILDFGCGPGYFGKRLSQNSNDVFYVDIAQDELDSIDAPDNRKFLADATKPLPFKPESFDYVFCGDLLEHLEDEKNALENILKVLKPDGTAVISVPAHSKLYGHHDKLIGHLRRYDKKVFKEYLEKIGFKVNRCRYMCSLIFLPFLINQFMVKKDSTYKGKSKIEEHIIPLLNFIAEVDSRLKLPFGIGLVFIAVK